MITTESFSTTVTTTHGTARPDLVAVKARQRLTWASGDYGAIATTIVPIAEQLCEAVDLRAGSQVLDVACGTGNAALAAARRNCDVFGIDYVPALLDRASERAAAERLPVIFRVADAEAMPFPDGAFDVVLSVVGAMFAPDQERTAAELLRVCRPGGKIGLASWTPDGFIGEMFRVVGRHVPPPVGVKPPPLWGTAERLGELFGDATASLRVVRRRHVFRYRSPEHWLAAFRTTYGPTLKAFEAVGAAGEGALAGDLLALARRFNQSGDASLAAPAEYLEAVMVKLGGPSPDRDHPEDWR